MEETWLGRGSSMEDSQMWTRISLSDEENDDMNIGPKLCSLKGSDGEDGWCPTKMMDPW